MKKEDLNDWQKLTEAQKQGILDAIKEIDSGKEIPYKKVMEEMRRKYFTKQLK